MQPDTQALLDRYESLFQAGHYFEAHEIAEEIWIANGRQRPSLWLGLVQIAVSYEHKKRGNNHGAGTLNERARLNLEFCQDQTAQFDFLTTRAINLLRSITLEYPLS